MQRRPESSPATSSTLHCNFKASLLTFLDFYFPTKSILFNFSVSKYSIQLKSHGEIQYNNIKITFRVKYSGMKWKEDHSSLHSLAMTPERGP